MYAWMKSNTRERALYSAILSAYGFLAPSHASSLMLARFALKPVMNINTLVQSFSLSIMNFSSAPTNLEKSGGHVRVESSMLILSQGLGEREWLHTLLVESTELSTTICSPKDVRKHVDINAMDCTTIGSCVRVFVGVKV